MTTTLQIVDTDLVTVLFDFNDATGAANPNGLKTTFGVAGTLAYGVDQPETVTISPTGHAGGQVVYRRDPLATMSWSQRFFGVTYDAMAEAVGILTDYIASGGILKFVPDGSALTRYVDFEPSRSPVLLNGQEMGLFQLLQMNDTPQGVVLQLTVQPYLRGPELLGTGNPILNATLLHDFGGTANRPDNWVWDSTTGISAESLASGLDWGYRFTIADSAVHNLQQSTATGTAAPGDVWTGSFYAKVDAVAGTPQARVVLRFLDSASVALGSDQNGTITTLSTTWQRLTVTTTAAPASTSKVRISLQQDNVTATSVVVRYRMAQVEKTSAVTGFRSGPEPIQYDPASAVLPRRIAVYAPGTAPTAGRLTMTADAATLGEVSVYRETVNPVTILQQTTHKQLESGTLGTGTASAADGNASAGNTAEVTYPGTTPVLVADTSGDITSTTIVVTKPASVAEGHLLLAVLHPLTAAARNMSFTTIPFGWSVVLTATDPTTGNGFLALTKVASSSEPASWTFVLDTGGTAVEGRWWVGAHSNVDPATPVDTTSWAFNGIASANITAPTVTTTRNNNLVVFIGAAFNTTGTFTHTPPAGTTPTYTEQEDSVRATAAGQWAGLCIHNGNLATAGATGSKTSAITVSGKSSGGHIVLNGIPSLFEERARQTWSALKAGDYDVWLRFYPTAASVQRLECEWAPVASPTTWHSMGEFVVDTSSAAAFAYVYRKLGRIHIPAEWPLSTLTIRINSGLDTVSSAKLRLDFLDLIPVNEVVGTMTAPSSVGSGAKLSADSDSALAFQLDSSSNLVAIGTASGAIPFPLEPGLNVLTVVSRQTVATGFDDPAGVLTAAPTLALDVTPRYR